MAPRHVPEGSWEEDYFIRGELVSLWGTSDSEKGIRQEVSKVTTSFKRRFSLKSPLMFFSSSLPLPGWHIQWSFQFILRDLESDCYNLAVKAKPLLDPRDKERPNTGIISTNFIGTILAIYIRDRKASNQRVLYQQRPAVLTWLQWSSFLTIH